MAVHFEDNASADESDIEVPKPRPQINKGRSRRASLLAPRDPEREAQQKAAFKEKKWPYSMFKGFETDRSTWVTLMGCTSSAIVLGVRLWLDSYPMAYVIHSIIVFFDMILIHMFTKSLWLSVTGEVITYIHVILFTLTKESVWELLETVLLAVLSSIYMINDRKKVMQERDQKDLDLDSLRERGALLLRNIHQVHSAIQEHHESTGRPMRESVVVQMENEKNALAALEKGTMKDLGNGDLMKTKSDDIDSTQRTEIDSDIAAEDTELTRELLKPGECSCSVKQMKTRVNTWLKPFNEKMSCNEEKCEKNREFREMFFEYFLDGAAGVMYTSFLGLVIDAFMNYGSSPY
mmetsp:Transcript_45161/g.109280  ORF Transcript_45161/g.109280 Transcript_45161/m.109280 type:complete len:349 (+) Transcript_45161:376-1422(+)|eukprot:CAMPEP_0113619088 /NCGR_PEP_ID=MMETSP0017_2-20120614/9684_1 /TAXON_ID=2856 /ORGANISM="Cylindrotheca closterium" /LENGTH=348 /DNA_ID=CAMNT_0000528641 /DNA_START=249 /DNA_END=1295 /DNA_ORIENTATION=+ /assembly_acc=CAM_ASM_000147